MKTVEIEPISNMVAVFRGFTKEQIDERKRRNREDFEEKCKRQGEYLPSDSQLTRWFGGR